MILDGNDNVILDTAQIVTNQAIDQAREAGVLDILLDSVHELDPELSPEALYSRLTGEASIDAGYAQKPKPQDSIS